MPPTYDLNPAKKRGINSGSGLRRYASVNHAVINKINPSTPLRVAVRQAHRPERSRGNAEPRLMRGQSIKFATDETTYQRAVDLYESDKVTEVKEAFGDFTAVVLGTKPYRVSVSGRRYKDAHCTCYLGEKGTLCKHAVVDGRKN